MAWQHLSVRSNSTYKQLFVDGTRILASSVSESVSAEGWSDEEAAAQFRIPVEAVREAITYSYQEVGLIDQERLAALAGLKRISKSSP